MSAQWTGTVDKGSDPNTVVVVVRDGWGWTATLRGTLKPGGGYALVGTLGEPPAALRIPAIDGEAG